MTKQDIDIIKEQRRYFLSAFYHKRGLNNYKNLAESFKKVIKFDDQFNEYLEKIEKKEPFFYNRYNDGEWMDVFGLNRNNYYLHARVQKQSDEFIEALNGYKYDNFIMALQPDAYIKMGDRIDNFLKEKQLDINWVNSDLFAYASMVGSLNPFVQLLRKNNVVFIAPYYFRNMYLMFRYNRLITTPMTNCYNAKETVKKMIIDYHEQNKNDFTLYLFSACTLSKVLIYELYPVLKGNIVMDMGSLWDVYAGFKTRFYHHNIPVDIIQKNIK
ncbi:MAG: hypothetical protein WC783_03865 [Candidatus Paceibacterota bacterium]|jgi:hypothetical protein